MTQYELVQARRYLQQDVLSLKRVEGISATTLKIVWDVSAFRIFKQLEYSPSLLLIL